MSLDQCPVFRNIKGILFDVDGTLYHQTPLRVIMFFLLVSLNFHNPKELLKKFKVIIYYRKAQETLRKSHGIQGENSNNQLMLTAEITGERPSYISEVVEEWFEKRPIPFIRLCRRRGLKHAFEIWHKKGLKLGVYSDYPVRKDKLHALGIYRFITTIVSANDSEVYGFKPKTNGFAIAAKKMGVRPSDILYVGDRPEVDGVGASEAGMRVMILKGITKKGTACHYPSFCSFRGLLKYMRTMR